MVINLYNTNSAKNVVNKSLEKITEYYFTDFNKIKVYLKGEK